VLVHALGLVTGSVTLSVALALRGRRYGRVACVQ
jgi:hypothetical protein